METEDTYIRRMQEIITVLRGSRFLPKYLKTDDTTEADLLYIFLRGKEIGLPMIQTLECLYMSDEGKICLDSYGMKALILAAGHRIITVEWTNSTCKLQGVRYPGTTREWSDVAEYNLENARLEGVLSRPMWAHNPSAMLFARAVSILGRNVFSDVLKGCYSIEEVNDHRDIMKATRIADGGAIRETLTLPSVAPLVNSVGATEASQYHDYMIESTTFTGPQKTKPLKDWGLGAVRYVCSNQPLRATLTEGDGKVLEVYKQYLTSLATKGMENEDDIRIGE